MERLEAKRVKGHTYYYYSHWAHVDNRCRRVCRNISANWKTSSRPAKGPGRPPFPPRCSSGDCRRHSAGSQACRLVGHVDRHCPKRRQGLTIGQYLAIAAINRAISPRSKRSMWDWFSQTVLRRHLPSASQSALSSQRFWTTWMRSSPRPQPPSGRTWSKTSSIASGSTCPRSATTVRISTPSSTRLTLTVAWPPRQEQTRT